MSRFIIQSACRGQRPAGVAPPRMMSRPRLVSRLLENRGVLRAVVAPDGYGKATLACEYAEVVFGFSHVFWINGASPCFLRDLDADVIEGALVESDPDCALVVLADVPWLEGDRAQALSHLVDRLLERGIEVLATMRPFCDCLGPMQGERTLIDADMLLVTPDEAQEDTVAPLAVLRGEHDFARRIPCLRWGVDGSRQLIGGCRADRLPNDMLLTLWVMLVMGQGTLQDVQLLLGQCRGKELWNVLGAAYPFVGVERGEDSFTAVLLDMTHIHEAFGRSMDELARTAGCADRDDLALRVAGWLAQRGEAKRAVELLGHFAVRGSVARWLDQFGWQLLWTGRGRYLKRLYGHVTRQRLESRPLTNAMMAWASLQVGDASQALIFARRVLVGNGASTACRAVAALCARAAGNAEVRAAMEDELALCWQKREKHGWSAPEEELLDLLIPFALGQPAGPELCGRWIAQWEEACRRADLIGASDNAELVQAGLLGVAWVLEALAAEGAFEPRGEDEKLLANSKMRAMILECVHRLAEVVDAGEPLGFGGRRAAEMLELMGDSLARVVPGGLPSTLEAALNAVRCEEALDAGSTPAPKRAPSPVPSRSSRRRGGLTEGELRQFSSVPTAPLLHVRLFGSMKVSIGGKEVSEALFSKRQARLLLALLVLNRGRDLTREEIAGALWPQSVPRTALKSFYRLWQNLASILSVQGECPYLLRDRQRCRLNTSLFTSDVMEFEALMRSLLFGLSESSVGWEGVLRQVQDSFASELLPGEDRCSVVVASRRQFASDLIDGLVAASAYLRIGGNPQASLWFAREAYRRERTREDVYEALMAAQISSGQRSAAMETYLACRAFLSEEMGLDPSERLRALYSTLLEGERVAY